MASGFCAYFVLQYILLQMHVCFCFVRFSFSVVSQETGWGEHLRNDLFRVGWDVKPLTQSIKHLQRRRPVEQNLNVCVCSSGIVAVVLVVTLLFRPL